jgi:hypothetical protein
MGASFGWRSSYLCFPSCWDYRYASPNPTCFVFFCCSHFVLCSSLITHPFWVCHHPFPAQAPAKTIGSQFFLEHTCNQLYPWQHAVRPSIYVDPWVDRLVLCSVMNSSLVPGAKEVRCLLALAWQCLFTESLLCTGFAFIRRCIEHPPLQSERHLPLPPDDSTETPWVNIAPPRSYGPSGEGYRI